MSPREDAYQRAYDRAVRLLARRAHSVWELQQKLSQGKTSLEVVHRVCERCRELGYLDDADFALSRTRFRLLHGQHGPRRVWAELRALHVEAHHIQSALDELLAETSEFSLAAAALAKRFGEKYPARERADEGFPDEAPWHTAPLRAAQAGDRFHAELSGAEAWRDKKRRYDFLARRGFTDDAIRQVLE